MKLGRREFLAGGVAAGAAITTPASAAEPKEHARNGKPYPYKLGMVTYNMGKDMPLDELLAFCEKVGLEGVELRTTHAHGVEPSLRQAERAAVRAQALKAGVWLAGLGTTCEFHSKDPEEVKRQIQIGRAFAQLAADVGAPGIKVRPNGLHEDEDPDKTLKRIGEAWAVLAEFGAALDVEVRMEVHGNKTKDLQNIRKMLDYAGHPNCKVCWNSNTGEEDENGSIRPAFELVKDAITLVHINEIGVYQYPWQELFDLLGEIDYEGFCLAEIAHNPEPERFMKHYRTLFDLYTGNYKYPQPEESEDSMGC